MVGKVKVIEVIFLMMKWNKVFKNGPSKIFGRQPLKNLKGLLGPFLNSLS